MPKILAIRPAPAGAGGRAIAFVDIQLTPDCRLFNLRLVDTVNGLRVYAPSAFGSKAVTFTAGMASELIRLATIALGDIARHDRNCATD